MFKFHISFNLEYSVVVPVVLRQQTKVRPVLFVVIRVVGGELFRVGLVEPVDLNGLL